MVPSYQPAEALAGAVERADGGGVSSSHVQAGQGSGRVGGRGRPAGAVREAGPAARNGVPVPGPRRRPRRVRRAGDRRAPLLRVRRPGAGLRGAAAQRMPAARLRQLPALPARGPGHPERRAGGPSPPPAEGAPLRPLRPWSRRPSAGGGNRRPLIIVLLLLLLIGGGAGVWWLAVGQGPVASQPDPQPELPSPSATSGRQPGRRARRQARDRPSPVRRRRTPRRRPATSSSATRSRVARGQQRHLQGR